MNYTTENTFLVSIRVWHTDEQGSRFLSKTVLVSALSEDEARAKVAKAHPHAKIEWVTVAI